MKKVIFLLLFTFLWAGVMPLTPQEKTLLKTHPIRCISTGLWAPFNLLENDKLVGIGFDYWNLIRDKLGIKNGCKTAENWIEVLEAIKNKTADITIATQPTPERLKYAEFSKPYVTYPIVIATKNDVGFIHNIDLIKEKSIAMGRDYAIVNILKEYYPDLKVNYVESIDEALSLVENNDVFATLEILPVLAYKLNKNKFYNLKISGSIPYTFSIGIMLRKDYSVLLPLINKAIDSITKEEKNKINERWIQIHHSKKISSIYFYILLATASLVVLFFAIWLFLLKREIIKKNQKEKELKKLISIDSLTNIFNRYMLDNTLNKEILLAERYDAPLSIIFFDIDSFKNINDTYGHKVGDYILKEFSKVIVNSIRKSDVFGRWGGDEFLIILVNTKEEYAKIFAKNLEVKIAKHHFVEHIPLRCTFGVASYQKNDTPVDIIKRVDENFYKEKNLKSKIESEY